VSVEASPNRRTAFHREQLSRGCWQEIVGAEQDSYYDVFGADDAAIAITPVTELRTVNIPTVGVGTDPGQDVTTNVGNYYSDYNLTYQNTTEDRQLHAYEVLADPRTASTSLWKTRSSTRSFVHLESGTSVYPPSLGKSEYLATITDVEAGRTPTRITDEEIVDVDSVVPGSLADAIPQSGVTYGVERSPAVMEQAGSGRRTTRFDDYVYTQQPENAVRVRADTDAVPVSVGSRTVVFRAIPVDMNLPLISHPTRNEAVRTYDDGAR